MVGSGALVWRAAMHAASAGKPVEAVIHPHGEDVPAQAVELNCVATHDVNELAEYIGGLSIDRLVCSTGNPFIFRTPILDLGLTIVNVHGAPLPRYRGLPLATAAFAILRSEREFGVTLHRVDAGIDTGPVVDRRTFSLSSSVTLEELSLQVTDACHEILTDNIDDLDRVPEQDVDESSQPGEYFGFTQLASISTYRDHPNFDRATDLGVLDEFYPSYAELFEAARSRTIR
ncbi:formyltransferase family protein [Rhodococcus artemisiae]|nr:formyltransferase family protein [Rhodococcus artemisiae]